MVAQNARSALPPGQGCTPWHVSSSAGLGCIRCLESTSAFETGWFDWTTVGGLRGRLACSRTSFTLRPFEKTVDLCLPSLQAACGATDSGCPTMLLPRDGTLAGRTTVHAAKRADVTMSVDALIGEYRRIEVRALLAAQTQEQGMHFGCWVAAGTVSAGAAA